MCWRVCRASLVSRLQEHPSPPSWDGQNCLQMLPKARGSKMALVETGRECACTRGHLLGEGPGWLDQGWAWLKRQSGGPARSPKQAGGRGWESTSHLGTKALPGAWFQPGLGPGPRVQEEVRVSGVQDAAQKELRGQAGRGFTAGEHLEVRRGGL